VSGPRLQPSSLPHSRPSAGPLLFKDDLAANRPEYRDFNLIVPNGPGFGVVVDEDKLAFCRRDAERRERRS
jgi:L-alanine-DL-glutamate epimerase-like enolase superfamily enzyme